MSKLIKRKLFGKFVYCIETNDIKIGDKIIPKTWSKKNIETFFTEIPKVEFIQSEKQWDDENHTYNYGVGYHLHKKNESGGYFFETDVLKVLDK